MNEQDEVYTGNNCNYPWQHIPRQIPTHSRKASSKGE